MPNPLFRTVPFALCVAASCLSAQAPTLAQLLPESPAKALLARLAQQPPAAKGDPRIEPKTKAELLRPELHFRPRERWLLLPDLARQLGTDDDQRDAVKELLDAGVPELQTALAAEGAESDLGTAAVLCITQLWQFARGMELPEAQVDALHAQIVATLAVPEVGKMRNDDKQRLWEFCVGYTLYTAGIAEVAEEEPAKAELRKTAGRGLEALLGVGPDRIELGARGLTAIAAREPATGKSKPAAPPTTSPPTRNPTPSQATALPATGAAIPGIAYDAPTGWTREESNGNVIFRGTLGDVDKDGRPEENNRASHQATFGFLPVLTATKGATALFDQTWRDQFAPFELGDTFVHYRARLPSQLVVLYMGRFFARPGAPPYEGNPKTYGALYLVDLGGNRFQPLIALVEPRSTSIGMDVFKESAALQALSFPLWKLLQSVRPAKGAPPYPAGGFFAAADLRGRWTESGGAFGGNYYNTTTGSYAGAAVLSSGGKFFLRDDGTYEYAFAYAASHPQFGKSGGSTSHDGRYQLNGDIVLVEPKQALPSPFTCCAVGTGVRLTKDGPRRVLVTVQAQRDGGFRAPSLVPNWDYYDGTKSWYTEDLTGK